MKDTKNTHDLIMKLLLLQPDGYSEPSQTSNMELFAKIVID